MSFGKRIEIPQDSDSDLFSNNIIKHKRTLVKLILKDLIEYSYHLLSACVQSLCHESNFGRSPSPVKQNEAKRHFA